MIKAQAQTKKMIIFAIYLVCMVLANLMGGKITYFFNPNNSWLNVSVAIYLMPFLCCVCDIAQECFGKDFAHKMVRISTYLMLLVIAIQAFFVFLPAAPRSVDPTSYSVIFKQSIRMSIASFASFFIAQRVDVAIFAFIKKLTSGKYLFLRNNVSTILSQFVDTVVFMYLCFWHMNSNSGIDFFNYSGKFTTYHVFMMVLPYFCFKVLFSFLNTPICYLGRLLFGKSEENLD